MAKILFDPNGNPAMAFGQSYNAVTMGQPTEPVKTSTSTQVVDDKQTVDNYEIANWGADNNFPQLAEDIIGKTGVLNTGLKFIRNFTIGQGIFACTVTGYDADGNETLEVINNPEITKLLQGRMLRRYMANTARDYFKFGTAFAELIPNIDGSKILGINPLNALYCRQRLKEKGIIPGILYSGKWPDRPAAKEDYSAIDLLDNYDPFTDLNNRRMLKKLLGKSVVYAVRDEWSNNEYHPVPIWWSAYRSGWINIAQKVPAFLVKMYENQITAKWHIQIPYAYWEKKYPQDQYKEVGERQQAIQKEMDAIEKNLVSEQNANKAIFTMFETNPNGKVEEQWTITALDGKNNASENLINSAAANSEICFALMINPNVFGAGMPGGTYAGNQGGSNIREAFLVNIALAWLDRQNLLDPLEAMLEFNGITDVQLRFRNTILTTLDTGAGTVQKPS